MTCTMVSAGKLRTLWDSLSELRSPLCKRRLERKIPRRCAIAVKTAQFTKFSLYRLFAEVIYT